MVNVFERLREISCRNYGLDCARYVSDVFLRFDAFLKRSKVELQLLSDIYVHAHCTVHVIRGGPS